MATPQINVDFHNADVLGRVRLNTIGSIESLAGAGTRLTHGLAVVVHDDELEADGVVTFSPEEHIWVAEIDWDAIRHVSEPAVVQHG